MTDDITPRQDEFISRLPGTPEEIATEMDISVSRARAYKALVVQAGYPVRNEDGVYTMEAQSVEPPRVSPSTRSQVTRQANEALAELEAMTEKAVTGTIPRDPTFFPESREELVLMRCDDHIGSGNTPVLKERVSYMSTQAVQFAEGMNPKPSRLWAMFNGDTVTGTDVFREQMVEVDMFLQDQIPEAVFFYKAEIEYLADNFEEVVCVFQKGNHGKVKGIRDGFNADKTTYEWLISLIRQDPSMDNVVCILTEDEYFVNVEIMGNIFHVRHGQNMLPHVGTPSSKEKARAWSMQYHADAILRAHFHFPHHTMSIGQDVLMGGSVTDPGAFEDGLGVFCDPHGTMFTVKENQPIAQYQNYNLSFIQ